MFSEKKKKTVCHISNDILLKIACYYIVCIIIDSKNCSNNCLFLKFGIKYNCVR